MRIPGCLTHPLFLIKKPQRPLDLLVNEDYAIPWRVFVYVLRREDPNLNTLFDRRCLIPATHYRLREVSELDKYGFLVPLPSDICRTRP